MATTTLAQILNLEFPVPATPTKLVNPLLLAHKLCTDNKHLLEKSEVCGCFVCFKVFKSAEVLEWTDFKKTARCPYCWTETVVPQSSMPVELTEVFLKRVYEYLYSPLMEIAK